MGGPQQQEGTEKMMSALPTLQQKFVPASRGGVRVRRPSRLGKNNKSAWRTSGKLVEAALETVQEVDRCRRGLVTFY